MTDRVELLAERRYCECGHAEGIHGGDGKWCLALRTEGPGSTRDRICWCVGYKQDKS